MKTNMIFGLGVLALLVSMPVVKGWGWSQPDFGSEKYAQRLADVFAKDGEAGLKRVIEQEVPAQQREKISLEQVAMLVGEIILPRGPEKLSAKDKEEIGARAESLHLLLIKMGCGSMQERKKIADVIVRGFELRGNEVFVKAKDVDAGESYEDLLHRRCKVVFKGEAVDDIVLWKNDDHRRVALFMVNANVRVLKALSDNKTLLDILAERDAQNGADKPAQGEQKAQ